MRPAESRGLRSRESPPPPRTGSVYLLSRVAVPTSRYAPARRGRHGQCGDAPGGPAVGIHHSLRSASKRKSGVAATAPSLGDCHWSRASSRIGSEVGRDREIVGVPVFDRSVLCLHETEQTAARAVAERMAAGLNRVSGFDVIARDAYPLELDDAGGLERPTSAAGRRPLTSM